MPATARRVDKRAGPRPGPSTDGTTLFLAAVACGALGIWLGIHALRAYLTKVVWNVAEDAPATQMGLVALAVWVVGLAGYVPARLLGQPRAMRLLGLLFAMLTVVRQTLPGESSSPILAFATVIAWLWWLPAYLTFLEHRGVSVAAVPAVLGGLVGLVAGQSALHGLDVQVMALPGSLLVGLVLAGTFAAAQRWAYDLARTATDQPPRRGAWGAAVLGPYLFIQLTLLTNLGRLQVSAGRDLLPVAAVTSIALLAARASLRWPLGRRVSLVLAALSVALLAAGEWSGGWALLALVPVQIGLAVALRAAFSLPTRPAWFYPAFVGGALVFFVLLFVYYSGRDILPALWPIAAALVALPVWRATPPEPLEWPQPVVAGALVAVLGLGLGLVPSGGGAPAREPAPTDLKVFNYNIHQSLDYYSVPSAYALADVIQAADADIVSLQEVNRGWNISGGTDTAAWLRWRFPGYYIVYGQMQTQLFGAVIMSKYPILDWGWQRYPRGQSTNTRGYVWATIGSQAGDVVYLTTHLTPYAGFDEDRAGQAAVLEQFWKNRPRTIYAGDFNAEPTDAAIQRLLGVGLQDVPAVMGQGGVPTYSAGQPSERIDYIFASPDVTPLAAAIGRTLASDHLPVSATIRIPQ
jgi:endonuclease/exonuclease/phosphatase family metal-dependent hydrolase